MFEQELENFDITDRPFPMAKQLNIARCKKEKFQHCVERSNKVQEEVEEDKLIRLLMHFNSIQHLNSARSKSKS